MSKTFMADIAHEEIARGSFHPTTDVWHPSYERIGARAYRSFWSAEAEAMPKEEREDWVYGGLVRSTLHFDPPLGKPRVSFWGADDTGMERSFDTEEEARRFLCHLPCIITMEWLRSVRFGWA